MRVDDVMAYVRHVLLLCDRAASYNDWCEVSTDDDYLKIKSVTVELVRVGLIGD